MALYPYQFVADVLKIDERSQKAQDATEQFALRFRPIDPRALDLTPKRKSVEISFDIGSNTWDMDNEGIVAAFKEVLKDRPVYVHKGRLFSSVNISTKEESEEEKRQKILKKLSPEERRILGIEE